MRCEPCSYGLGVAMLLASLLASACNGARASLATASTESTVRGPLRLDPANPMFKYIKVETVVESDQDPGVVLTGRVTFDEDRTQRVASPIDGRAVSILVKQGDKVKPGQPLIELSSPHVGELQAEAQKARQELDVQEKALLRAKRLKEDGAISEKEAVQVESDFRKARLDTMRASAQLKSLSLSAAEPNVAAALRAQIAGTVVERNVLVGQEVRADSASPLLTVSNLDSVWVLADVYEQDLGLVHKGDPVKVQVMAYPGDTFSGEVAHVGEVVDPATRTVKVRCVLANPGTRLKPEMFARVELHGVSAQPTISIPSRAVLTDTEHARVIAVGEGEVFQSRVIEIGPEVDGKVRVLRGLAPRERIVTDGAIFLAREMGG